MTTKATSKTNILINHHHFTIDGDDILGRDLKALAEILGVNLLFREVRGPGDDEQIQDDTLVHLHDGDHFYDMPPGSFGRR